MTLVYDAATDSVVIRSAKRRADEFSIALVGLVMTGIGLAEILT